MPDTPLATAYDSRTGAAVTVPEHFIDHDVLGAGLRRTPPSGQPDESWTLARLREHAEDSGIPTKGARTKADYLAAITNPPAAGENTTED